MTDATPTKAGALVDAMDDAYAADAQRAEAFSGPTQAYSLMRDCCVPVFAMRILGKHEFRDVLDVGCGTGSHARIFAGFAGKVTGLDAAEGAVEIARQRTAAIGNLEFRTADIFTAELGHGLYDFAHVREFHPLTRDIYDDDTAKREAHRAIVSKIAAAVAPGGYIYIAHVKGKRQCMDVDACRGIEGVDVVAHGIDTRMLFLLAPVMGYRRVSLTLAKLLSLPFRLWRSRFFEMIVLKRLP
jgi:SAM-dependent methyltransferase